MSKTQRRDTGTGSVFKRASDGRWVAALELGYVGGKRKKKVFTGRTKKDAVDKMKKARGELENTGTIAPKAPTLATWLHKWLDEIAVNEVAPRTLQADRSSITQHLVPVIGHVRLDQLTTEHVLELHKTLRKMPRKRQPKDGPTRYLDETSVLRAHAVLSRALADAKRQRYVRDNVAKDVRRPKIGTPDVEFLNLAQATQHLAVVADNPHGSRWAFALLTGQRQGECLGLRWSHLDLYDDHGFADVSWQLQRLGYRHGCDPHCGRRFGGDCPNRGLEVKPGLEYHRLDGALSLTRPKGDVRKVVPLTASLVAWLRRHRDEQPPGTHDLVWTRDGERPIDLRKDYDAWIALLSELGLPRVKLHSARHSCVSLHMSLGTQENELLQMVGHSTIAAARRYQHLDRQAALRAAVRLARALKLEPEDLAELPDDLTNALPQLNARRENL
jgi:integrase